MATAFAATTIREPVVTAQGEKTALYTLQLPSSWPVAGQAWDLTDDFEYVYGIEPLSGNAYTDLESVFSCVVPAFDTAITSSNVLIAAHWGGGAGAALDATADTTDLSGVTALIVRVTGR